MRLFNAFHPFEAIHKAYPLQPRRRTAFLQAITLALAIFLTSLAACTYAVPPSRQEASQALGKPSGGFVTIDENDYYLTPTGERHTGLLTLNGETYCFLDSGKQVHGWRKIEGKYYHFSWGRLSEGILDKNTTIDGFPVDGNGAAILQTKGEKARMKAFAYVSSLLVKKAKSSWSDRKKLKALFRYAQNLPYVYDETDKTAAECVLKFKKQIDGDCADTNSLMAFAGAILGHSSYIVNDYGHWWALIDGKVYDTNYDSFALTYQQARQKEFPYLSLQAIQADTPYAGSVVMTIYPDLHAYDTESLTVYGDSDAFQAEDPQ